MTSSRCKTFYQKHKTAIVIVVCTVLFCASLVPLSSLFVQKTDAETPFPAEAWDGFYKEPENSIDMVFLGSSRVLAGFMPTELYAEYGFTGYTLASSRMRYNGTELYLQEVLTRQKPKVVVIENKLYDDWSFEIHETTYRRLLDFMQLSPRKLALAKTIADADSSQSLISYVVPFLRYHDRWDELTAYDFLFAFQSDNGAYKGWINYTRRMPCEFEPISDEVNLDYNAESVEAFLRIKALCDENNIELIVVDMPSAKGAYRHDRTNGGALFFEEQGVRYLNLNTSEFLEASQLNASTDFWSPSHVNNLGTLKVTRYIGDYLSKLNLLEDHRADEDSAAWQRSVQMTRWRWMNDFTADYNDVYPAVKAVRQDDSVTLSWARMCFYNGVTVRRWNDAAQQWITLTQGITDASFVDEDAPANASYRIDFTVETLEDQPISFTVTDG